MTKLIVTDLDNTLLTADKTITPYTLETLRRCRNKGISFAIATARPLRTVLPLLGDLIPSAYIVDNGARIYFQGKEAARREIGLDMLLALIAALHAETAIQTITLETGTAALTTDTRMWPTEGWNGIHTPFEAMTHEALKPLCVTKVTVSCFEPDAVRAVVSAFPTLHMHANTGEEWIQIMRADATKANGLQHVCELLNITLADTVAFGDDENDADMLRTAGIGVAMANAIPACKAAADTECGRYDEDGMAKWLAENTL